jgi:4-amino-4-deoxy-L-arabinose transferase-like glycosyltransferase
VARATVYLLAFSPMAFFFSAPYTESLFLLLSVGAFYAARRERWWVAGAVAGLAAVTRNMGVLLVLPLAIMYFFPPGAPRRPFRASAGFLLLVPLGLIAYSWHLHNAIGDWLGWVQSHGHGGLDRHLVGPVIATKDAVVDAANSIGHLADARPSEKHFEINVFGLAALVAVVIGTVGVIRELGPAYGAYTLAGLIWITSAPNRHEALLSFPRYATVLFPLFIWLAVVCERRKATVPVIAAFAVFLGLFTAQFATWQLVV